MPGLIDQDGTTGLAYTTGSGLQFESNIGNAGLLINPGEAGHGFILMESSGYILMEDGVSYILLE